MITGRPELSRYLDDAQWKAVSQAIRKAGGQATDGNRLHVDAVLNLMKTRGQWRDLDYRYGPWANIYAKFSRWFETGVLHGLVSELFKLGLTDSWRETYTEISTGPSARKGPQIRPLMAEIANQLRRHRDAPKKRGKQAAPKLPQPKTNEYRKKRADYQGRVKAAVKARAGLVNGRISQEDWAFVTRRIPELGDDNMTCRQVEELVEVMKTNKGWAYMDAKAGKWSVAYNRFMKWVSEGTMTRLVKCLHELGLTKDWNSFLVAPLTAGQKSLKLIVGAEAFALTPAGRKAKASAAKADSTKDKAARKPKTAKAKTKASTKGGKAASKAADRKKTKAVTVAKAAADKKTTSKSVKATKSASDKAKNAKVEAARKNAKSKARAKVRAKAGAKRIATVIAAGSKKVSAATKSTRTRKAA